MTQLFFGVGTGRVATMALANALNAERDCVCLHEGKLRELETSGAQMLPFLTLQNRLAYEDPKKAVEIVAAMRGKLLDVAGATHARFFGDVAYNNAPILRALYERYPEAKFVFLYRDCLGFLRSCTAVDGVDETPVGWPPESKALSPVEQYIALGRLQPRQGTSEAAAWPHWDYVTRNIWLWSETNRIILDALAEIPAASTVRVPLEDLQRDALAAYARVRACIGFVQPATDLAVERLTARPINARSGGADVRLDTLTPAQKEAWSRFAEPIRAVLGYA